MLLKDGIFQRTIKTIDNLRKIWRWEELDVGGVGGGGDSVYYEGFEK